MESRLIYESSKIIESKIIWTRIPNAESEWIYFDLSQPEKIEYLINDFFIADTLHISIGRHDSYTDEKSEVYTKVKTLIGQIDFKIWNENFTKTIEINKIGVYRTGDTSN